MKSGLSRLLTFLLLIASVFAQNGVLQLSTRKVGRFGHSNLSRRSPNSTLNATLHNQKNAYTASISVGTPAQKLDVILDTGSSDLWIPSVSVCPDSKKCPNGSFKSNDSSSYHDIGMFNISYIDQSQVKGDYFTDVLKLGNATLKNFTMGLGKDVNTTGPIQGVFGIGYSDNESKDKKYSNFPQALVEQGVINSSAYSLWLDDSDADTGSILFGGVDTSKFTGSLHALDIPKGNYLSVHLKSIRINDNDTATSNGGNAALDSGSTTSIVPKDVFDYIASKTKYDNGTGTIPCSQQKNESFLTFSFDQSVDIKVNLSEFIMPVADKVCTLGLQPSSGSSYVLGDNFLRSTYAVYDLENNQIALAHANFNPGSSNVLPFSDKGSYIPNATNAHHNAAVPLSETSGRVLTGPFFGLVVSTLLVVFFA